MCCTYTFCLVQYKLERPTLRSTLQPEARNHRVPAHDSLNREWSDSAAGERVDPHIPTSSAKQVKLFWSANQREREQREESGSARVTSAFVSHTGTNGQRTAQGPTHNCK